MLLLVTGASGAGKSTAYRLLGDAFAGMPVRCAEFDAVGVPDGADTAWRHGAVDEWTRRACAEQRAGRHLVLFGQVPVGELLAAPVAEEIEAIHACLLHCSPEVRRRRLALRGDDPETLTDHLKFGEWLHAHTLDPTHRPEVIRVPSSVTMQWDRWTRLEPGDPRWQFEVIDTDQLPPDQVARRVRDWVVATIPSGRT